MQRFLFSCAALALALSAAPAAAQPAGALGEYFIHRIQSGDTLFDLAQTYTHDNRNWPQLQSLNRVEDPYRLMLGREVRIPLSLIPREAAQAELVHVSGPVRIGGSPAQVGAVLEPGSEIVTAGGHATLRLEDGSLITLPPGTSMQLDQLAKFRGTDLTDTVLQMASGSVDASVAPDGSGVGRFEVRTPLAVTGVRGTRFRIVSAEQGEASSVVEGSVRLQGRPGGGEAGPPTVVALGYGSLVRSDGTVAGTRKLLPAPEVSPPVRQGGQWQASITPVEDAAAYRVGVSRDPEGLYLVSSTVSQDTDIRFSAPGAGTYYVSVQAVDALGIGGLDTRHSFVGAMVLLDSQGNTIATGTGGSILLADY